MATIIGSTNTSVWTFKLETTEGAYDIANNTSPLTVDIYIGRISSSGSYMTGAKISGEVTCTGCNNLKFSFNKSDRLDIGAGKWYKIASVTFSAVPHDPDGSKIVNVSASFTSNISPKSGSAAGDVTLTTIPRQATLASAPDFTDEENPTIYFNNPAGTAATVKVCISFTGKNDDIKYYTLPDPTVTSYTFPLDEIIEGDTRTGHEILRAGTTSGKTYRFVTFFVTTIIGDVTYYSTLQRTYTVVNCAPELNPIVEDMGDHSYKLTNNRSKLIRYFNYPKITFYATPKKGADIVNKSVTCGTQTKNTDGDYVYLNNVDSDTFIVSVTDNRGITVTKEIKMDMIPYVNLTCNTEINNELGTDTTNSKIHITVKGEFYTGLFRDGTGVNEFPEADIGFYMVEDGSEPGWKYDDWCEIIDIYENTEMGCVLATIKNVEGYTEYAPLPCFIGVNATTLDEVPEYFKNATHYKAYSRNKGFAVKPGTDINNSLIVEFRYKTNDDTDYPETWTDISSQATLYDDTNKYSVSTVIDGVNYTKTYMIQVRARDLINPSGIYARDENVKIRPVFDWSESDFNFNVPIFKEGNPVGYYPIGSVYTSEDNSDPGTLFGGTWQLLRTFHGGELIAYGTAWNDNVCNLNAISSTPYGFSDILPASVYASHIINNIPDVLIASSGTIWVQTKGIVGLVEANVEISGMINTGCTGIWFRSENKNELPSSIMLTGGQGLMAVNGSYSGASSKYFYNVSDNDPGSSFYINPTWSPYGGDINPGVAGTKCTLHVKAYAKGGTTYMWKRVS